MSPTWTSDAEPAPVRITAAGWLRAVLRGVPLAAVLFGGLGVLLFVRLIERPLCGVQRVVTPHITRFVCRLALFILGLRYTARGTPLRGSGAVVANHSSWLDIFVLNARKTVYFVSKSEVADWPAIGLLARATGTVFIKRDRREAKAQEVLFQDRLRADHRLLFFPEGTSTDGCRVLPFKTTLFAAFFAPGLRETMRIQPVTVLYHVPPGADPRFFGWWGDMDFGPHLLKVLAASPQGSVDVVYHEPVRVSDCSDRKALAAELEARVRSAMPSPG